MRRLHLKVCGMRDAENIATVGALCPDYMGFIFVPTSPRFVGLSLTADAISIPPSVKRIGVFQDASLQTVIDTVFACKLHGVQLHGDEGRDYLRSLKNALPDTTIIKAVRIQTPRDIIQIPVVDGLPDLFLFDSASGGSGSPFNWTWLSHYTGSAPYLLAGGIGIAELDAVERLAEEHPLLHGIDINSRVERAPGFKDPHRIQEIVTRLGL